MSMINVWEKWYNLGHKFYFKDSRKYGPLSGQTFRSLVNFWCSVVTQVTFSCNLKKKKSKVNIIPIIQYEHKQKNIFQKYVIKSENMF